MLSPFKQDVLVKQNVPDNGKFQRCPWSHGQILWNHFCSWGIDFRGFRGSPFPTNLRVPEPLSNNPNF